MAIFFSDNIRIASPKPLDERYYNTIDGLSPWTSQAQVNDNIANFVRYVGLTVNINNEEYWYATGTSNTDLVKKIVDVTESEVLYNNVYMWTGTTAEPHDPIKLDVWYDNTQSAGRLTGGVISESNKELGTINVAAGSGLIKLVGTGEQIADPNFNTDRNAVNKYVEWDAVEDLQLVAGYNFIFYNANTNQIEASANEVNIQNNTNFNIGRVFWDSQNDFITIRECGQNLWNLNRRLHRVGDELFGVQRASGLITTNPSLRYISVSSGVLWAELLNRFQTTTFNSGLSPLEENTFIEWYKTGDSPTTWGAFELNQISDFWNDGNTREEITTGYTVHWVYVVHDSSVHVVLHDQTYSGITDARLASPRAELPPLVVGYATLSARVIQNVVDTTITEINSVFDVVIGSSVPAQHNDLGGIDGDGTFHLSAAQVQDVQKIPNIEAITDVAITGASNGLRKEGNHDVELGGELDQSTTITIVSGTSLYIEDLRTDSRGIKYVQDYSTYFTPRSLVDKAYVDSVATGLVPVNAVDVATTSGITLSGLQEIDGVLVSDGNRVLVKDQSNAIENGIYIASGGTWARAEDYDGTPEGEVQQGNIIPVLSGDTQNNQLWVLVTPNPILIDTTPLEFARFSKPIDILAGDGINIEVVGGQKTINVSLLTNGGLTLGGSENDEIAIDDSIAGSGLTFTTGVLDVALATNGALTFIGNNVSVDETIAGSGLNWTNGVIDLDTAALGVLTASNGLEVDNQNVTLGGGLEHFTIFSGGTENYHLQYSSTGVSATFTSTSIPHVSYVTGLTSALQDNIDGIEINAADNGLSISGGTQTVVLGGNLVDSTTIDGNYANSLSINRLSDLVLESKAGQFSEPSSLSLGGASLTVDGGSGFCILGNNSAACPVYITYDGSEFGGIVVSVGTSGSNGIAYSSCYHSNYTKRSLVDKEYVDIAVSGVSTTAINAADNGLSISGGTQTVVLGGNLVEDTTIGGDNNQFALSLTNLRQLNLSADDFMQLNVFDEDDGSISMSTNNGFLNIEQTSSTSAKIQLDSNEIELTAASSGITITDAPTAITSEAFSVLVRDDVNGQIKTVDGSQLGEDNNNYFITTASTSITATTEMYVILVDSSAAAVTITLPATPVAGQAYKIKDATGDAITNIITIDSGEGNFIDNSRTAVINTDYGAIEIAYDADFDEWFVLSFVN